MKLFIVLALSVATVSSFDLRNNEIKSDNIGVPVKAPEGRITNGKAAAPGQFPYQVAINLKKTHGTFFCAGSLLNKEFVLTNAVCVSDLQYAEVSLGAINHSDPEITYKVYNKDIIIHPKFKNSFDYDIALIKIPATNFSSKIGPVKLPTIADSNNTYVDDIAIVSGWGHTTDKSTYLSQTLQYVQLKIISHSDCYKVYEFVDQKANLCAISTGGKSICRGDGGDPLVLSSTGVQVGITAFNSALGCTLGIPSGFTRVTSYLDFIREHVSLLY